MLLQDQLDIDRKYDNRFQEFSFAMKLARWLGLERIAWSLRRIHVPVPRDALVLEVGAGGNPYGRSDVLVDAYEESAERHWAPLVKDRPTVLAYGENLPFKDKVFDFVIACHVLEHSNNPAKFIAELQRVGKAGYIEVPNAFFEKINPYMDHRLEISQDENGLIITHKCSPVPNVDLVNVYKRHVKDLFAKKLFKKYPFSFHLRFYWKDQIPFKISDHNTVWTGDEELKDRQENVAKQTITLQFKQKSLRLINRAKRLAKSKRAICLVDILQCIVCHSSVTKKDNHISCLQCGARFPIVNGLPKFNS